MNDKLKHWDITTQSVSIKQIILLKFYLISDISKSNAHLLNILKHMDTWYKYYKSLKLYYFILIIGKFNNSPITHKKVVIRLVITITCYPYIHGVEHEV